MLPASIAARPASAGNGVSAIRFSANASCVKEMLFVMYGRSRTSSFGYTMKPFTYHAVRLTMT